MNAPNAPNDRIPEGPERQDRERVRSYIVSQAERYEPGDYWPRVMELRVRLLRLLDEMTPEQAAWRPPTGEGEAAWSAVEVAQHVPRPAVGSAAADARVPRRCARTSVAWKPCRCSQRRLYNA